MLLSLITMFYSPVGLLQYKKRGDESELHIIIFDELDAICKQRGSTGGGTGVGDSVVNQLLSKVCHPIRNTEFPILTVLLRWTGSTN